MEFLIMIAAGLAAGSVGVAIVKLGNKPTPAAVRVVSRRDRARG